jgi:multidrug transporter EmrE-like cation transporter
MVESRAAEQHADSHGNSVAAWTLVSLIMLGALVACLSVAVKSVPMAVVGGVLVVAGPVAGKVLAAMGYGVAGHR